ncbi:MAG: type IV secretion system DNA-binding domain-containing protein [Deferribacterales bacterium]
MSENHNYTGFEAWLHNLKMSMRMILFILAALVIVYLAVVVTYVYFSYDKDQLYYMYKWLLSGALARTLPNFAMHLNYDGKVIEVAAHNLFSTYYEQGIKDLLTLKSIAMKSLLVFLLFFPLHKFFSNKTKSQSKDEYARGSQLSTPKELRKQLRTEQLSLSFGEVKMPVKAEVKHCFIVGATGKGKTVLTSSFIEELRRRGEKAIIYDFKGDYVSRFFDPERDLLFNPLDSRSINWDIFSDMKTPMDIISMTASLIPEQAHTSQPFFNLAARDVFTGVVSHLFQTNQKNYSALWNTLTKSPEKLAEILRNTKGGTAGAAHIADPSNKQTGSVLSTMHLYSKIFEYFKDDNDSFSIEEWVKNGSGILFISNYDKLKETLKPILTMFIDTVARNLISMPDNPNNRLFFILDEFGTLQKMQRIVELLTLSRSKGGAVFLGIQDIGQIDNIYGKDLRNTIINACSTNAIFGVNDPDTADFLSRKIGDTEYHKALSGMTFGSSERNSVNMHRQKVREPLFIPSQIMQLPDLQCYVKFPNFAGCMTTLKPKSYSVNQEEFKMRSDLSLENIFWERQKIIDELQINKTDQDTSKLEKF